MEKAITWDEVDAVPGWRQRLRQQWYDAVGLPMPRIAQGSGNSGKSKPLSSEALKETR